MKIRQIVCAVAAASLTFGAFAQDVPYPPDGRLGNSARQVQPNANRDRQPAMRNDRNDAYRSGRNDAYRNDRHEESRGAGPEHRFYRGGRLPPEYHDRQYVVDDWRGHHLRQPPRGYHWVQVGGDYVLVAIATGIILSVLLNSQ